MLLRVDGAGDHEQRPAAGELEQTELAHVRARERAFLVPEQLRLDESVRDRFAIDVHEWTRDALGHPVQRARDELLARARLPRDEHR